MLASYLLDANRSSHPLEELALEHTGYKALTRRGRLRPRRQGNVVRADSRRRRRWTTPVSERTWRCSWRRPLRELLRRRSSTRVYDELEQPLHAGAGGHRAGRACASTAPALASQSQHVEQELARWRARDLRAVRRGVQHQLAEEARPRSCSTSWAEDRDDPPDDEDEGAIDGVRSARGAGAGARAAAARCSSGAG